MACSASALLNVILWIFPSLAIAQALSGGQPLIEHAQWLIALAPFYRDSLRACTKHQKTVGNVQHDVDTRSGKRYRQQRTMPRPVSPDPPLVRGVGV